MEEIEFPRWLFEGKLRQGKNVLPDGLNWLCYFAGSLKGHHENSFSCIFLESPHQVDMKNVVKCYKHFFFDALKTHCGTFFKMHSLPKVTIVVNQSDSSFRIKLVCNLLYTIWFHNFEF